MIVIYLLFIIAKVCVSYFQIFNKPDFLAMGMDLLFIFFVLFLIHTFVSKRSQVYWYAGVSLLVGILMLVCVLYARFYHEVPTYHSFSLIGEVGVVKSSATSLLKPLDFFYFIDLLLLPFLLYQAIVKKRTFRGFKIQGKKVGAIIISFLLIVSSFTFFTIKQDIISDSIRAKKMGLFTFNIATAVTGTADVKAAYITAKNIRDIKGEKLVKNPKNFGIAKGKNLIIIQLESFQRNLNGVKINGQSVTPTLDKLEKETLYSNQFFQTVSKSNTADAEWSVYTSTFPSGYYTNTQTYADRVIPSMPRLLGKNGYSTETFHTNDASFYNRENFYPAVGFDKFYDRKFFGDKDKIGFSASDEVLYNKTFSVLNKHYKNKQKFYSQLVTVSSHMPFKLPASKQTLTLPSDLQDTQLGAYYQAEHYADKQLGKFITKLKKSGIWDNSVVVMYGDHHIIDTKDLSAEEKKYVPKQKKWKTQPANDYRVSFFLHYPGLKKSGEIKNVGGEVDIMPTVMNLLGISTKKQIMFGKDILNSKSNFVAERYSMPEGSYFTNSYMYLPDESFETGKATNYNGTKKKLTKKIRSDFEASRKLLRYSDSYINQLPMQKDK